MAAVQGVVDGAFLGDELSCDNKMPYELYAQVTSRLRTALDALPGEHGQACERRSSPNRICHRRRRCGCVLQGVSVSFWPPTNATASSCPRGEGTGRGFRLRSISSRWTTVSLEPCVKCFLHLCCSYKPIFSVAQFKPFEICCITDITQTTAGGEAYYNGSNETAQVRALYEAELFPRMAPHQKAWAVPGAFSPPAGPQTPVLDKLQ